MARKRWTKRQRTINAVLSVISGLVFGVFWTWRADSVFHGVLAGVILALVYCPVTAAGEWMSMSKTERNGA